MQERKIIQDKKEKKIQIARPIAEILDNNCIEWQYGTEEEVQKSLIRLEVLFRKWVSGEYCPEK